MYLVPLNCTVNMVKIVYYMTFTTIKTNAFESVLMRRMNLEPIIQSEVSQKEKDKNCILMHIYRI